MVHAMEGEQEHFGGCESGNVGTLRTNGRLGRQLQAGHSGHRLSCAPF